MDFEVFLKQNEGLIWKNVNKYKSFGAEDIYQVCSIAMWKAYKDFNSTKGFKFSTFAQKYMFNEITKHIRKMHWLGGLTASTKLETVTYGDTPLTSDSNTTILETVEDETQNIDITDNKVVLQQLFDLQLLSESERNVMYCLVDSMTYQETANKLNKTIPAVRKYSYSAIKKLNNYVKEANICI